MVEKTFATSSFPAFPNAVANYKLEFSRKKEQAIDSVPLPRKLDDLFFYSLVDILLLILLLSYLQREHAIMTWFE